MTQAPPQEAAPEAAGPAAASDVSRGGISASRIVRFAAAMSALCAAAAFPASSAFDLRSVTVEGNGGISAAEVLERAGIGPGTSAFRVNEDAIRGRLREDPRVQNATVAMVFPRTLTLKIQERAPAAAMPAGDGFILVAANGVAIVRATGQDSFPRLVVDTFNPADAVLGAVMPSSGARLGAAIAGMLPDLLRSQVAAVHVDAEGDATLEMQDGPPVRLGGSGGIAERVGLVPQVLTAIAARGLQVQYVDLRFAGNIIIRPAGPAGAPATSSSAPAAGSRQENSGSRGIQPVLHRPTFP